MNTLPTVRIVHATDPAGYAVINEAEFDPMRDTRLEDADARAELIDWLAAMGVPHDSAAGYQPLFSLWQNEQDRREAERRAAADAAREAADAEARAAERAAAEAAEHDRAAAEMKAAAEAAAKQGAHDAPLATGADKAEAPATGRAKAPKA